MTPEEKKVIKEFFKEAKVQFAAETADELDKLKEELASLRDKANYERGRCDQIAENLEKQYDPKWSLTPEQVQRFEGVVGCYEDIFEFISDMAVKICDCDDCPVNCNPDNGDCGSFIYNYIKTGRRK